LWYEIPNQLWPHNYTLVCSSFCQQLSHCSHNIPKQKLNKRSFDLFWQWCVSWCTHHHFRQIQSVSRPLITSQPHLVVVFLPGSIHYDSDEWRRCRKNCFLQASWCNRNTYPTFDYGRQNNVEPFHISPQMMLDASKFFLTPPSSRVWRLDWGSTWCGRKEQVDNDERNRWWLKRRSCESNRLDFTLRINDHAAWMRLEWKEMASVCAKRVWRFLLLLCHFLEHGCWLLYQDICFAYEAVHRVVQLSKFHL